MKIIDWIAILGALAWTPHLFSLIKSLFTKPEIRVITQKTAEIGFTTYGPIFNMRIAFSVKNHDVVISNFRVRITHESGEEKVFEWQGVRQQVMKMHTSDGPIPYEKENSVLAIKLNQSEVEERIIQCQEVSFVAGKRSLEDKAIRKLSYDRVQTDYDPLNFLRSQDAVDVFNYIKHAFSWRAGKYKVVFELESPETFKLVDNEFEFSLLPMDVEELDKNKDFIEQEYVNNLVGEGNDSYKPVYWNWRNPLIYNKYS